MTLVSKVIGERDSIVVLGLSFNGLSPEQVAEISRVNIWTVYKLRKKYSSLLDEDTEANLQFSRDIGNCKKGEVLECNDWFSEILDLSEEKYAFWVDKYRACLRRKKRK